MIPESANICILPIRPEDIDLLCRHISAKDGAGHRFYAEMQSSGEGLYLIAWDEEQPVGHLFIRWTGSTEVPRIVDQYPQAAQYADCPEFCDLYVVPERRSQGIGARLLRRALELARERAAQVTLTVDVDNPRARALYERLGFVEVGIGPFTTSGVYQNEAGQDIPWQNGLQVMMAKKR